MSTLKTVLREDNTYLKYINILKMATRSSDFTLLTDEVENMHKGRLSRTLFLKEPTFKRLIDSALQDAAYRSRCIEIVVTTTRVSRSLQSAVHAVTNHIYAKYGSYLRDYKTKGEKESFIASIFQPAYNRISEIESIIEIAQFVVEDCDKMAWSIKHTQEALEAIHRPETPVKTIG